MSSLLVIWILAPLLTLANSKQLPSSSSIREMTRAAVLKSWPVGDKKTLMSTADEYLSQANHIDYDDCGKKTLCLLASKKKAELEWDESLLLMAFDGQIDYTSPGLHFSTAVQVGKKDKEKCGELYPRCYLMLEELLEGFRSHGFSVDIPSQNRSCSVYFFWQQSSKKLEKSPEGNTTTTGRPRRRSGRPRPA